MSELRHANRPERPGTSGGSVEYVVGEDENDITVGSTDDEPTDDSTTSDSDNDEDYRVGVRANGAKAGAKSRLPHKSPGPSRSLLPYKAPPGSSCADGLVCGACGRGPFRSMKLHLLHCSGVRVKFQCALCKTLFPSEKLLKEHHIPLFCCSTCGQVFSHKNTYNQHPCPKGGNSPLVQFCSEAMPKPCNICKAFFTSDKTLLNHVTRVHTSVVRTKLCIITNPSTVANKKASACVSGSVVGSAASGSGHILVSGQAVSQNPAVLNGKLSDARAPSPAAASSSLRNGPEASAGAVKPGNDGADAQTGAAGSVGETANAAPKPTPAPAPTIMALFENDSKEVALMKRMNTGWRHKATYPCRQCGAILRQPSLIISHRYLHRGQRSHRCQCGRAFKHRLHLLRHCVQHAEAVSYICANCGETFTGAKLLAEHLKGKLRKKPPSSGRTWKHRVKCKMPFTCECGQLFFRPSAYIWHLIKNQMEAR